MCSRALYWPSRKTVFVADVHLGKAAAFRARSIPLPHGTTQAAFDRLDQVLCETRAEQLIVLGDLWHDRLGRSADLMERLGTWTSGHSSVRFLLVAGNHDLKAGATPTSTGFETFDRLQLGPFLCLHHPAAAEGFYVLGGHIHPGMELGTARSSLKLPCFAFFEQFGILPAFGEFTGVVKVAPESESDVFCVVAEDKIFSFSGKHLLQTAVAAC